MNPKWKAFLGYNFCEFLTESVAKYVTFRMKDACPC